MGRTGGTPTLKQQDPLDPSAFTGVLVVEQGGFEHWVFHPQSHTFPEVSTAIPGPIANACVPTGFIETRVVLTPLGPETIT
jgi:hypothetical protein